MKKLIKSNDAMWGDLAVCALIKTPPSHHLSVPQQQENQQRKMARIIRKKKRKTKLWQWGKNRNVDLEL